MTDSAFPRRANRWAEPPFALAIFSGLIYALRQILSKVTCPRRAQRIG